MILHLYFYVHGIVDPLLGIDRKKTKFPTATSPRATIEELLKTVFLTRNVPGGYQWDKFRV
jgi:hypothetical protein